MKISGKKIFGKSYKKREPLCPQGGHSQFIAWSPEIYWYSRTN